MAEKSTYFFFGTCPALGEKTLVSDRVFHPFVTREFNIGFALNTQRKLRVKVFLSPDRETPVSGEPTGQNCFDSYGNVDYVVGDDVTLTFEHEIEVQAKGMWLKVYAENLDNFDHTIDVAVTIERIECDKTEVE